MEKQTFDLASYRYEPRPIQFLGVADAECGWKVKRYFIQASSDGSSLDPSVLETAHNAAIGVLGSSSFSDVSHKVAILTVHRGIQALWVLLDYWAYGDVLMHHHWRAPVEDSTALIDVSGQGYGPCVWELVVQAHERKAWLRHVLCNPARPNLDAYLVDGITQTI